MKTITFIAAAIVVALTGCAQQPPSCGDAETISLVKSIFREQVLPSAFRDIPAAIFDKGVRIELAVPTKAEKDINKISCEARFSVDASEELQGLDLGTVTRTALTVLMNGGSAATEQ